LYGELKTFFVDHLLIKDANAILLIKQISLLAKETCPNGQQIRQLILEAGMLLQKSQMDDELSKALNELAELAFLPVRCSDGDVRLRKPTDAFAIHDHVRYFAVFSKHPIFLDFSIEDSRKLHRLFSLMRIDHRYLSNMVKEISVVGTRAELSTVLSENLKKRAYALYWCVG
jgi:hypothetical protein